MPVAVRPASPDDAPAIAAIVAEALAGKVRPAFGARSHDAVEAMARHDMPRPTVRFLVADDGGQIVGAVRLALGYAADDTALASLASAIGWPRALRGAVTLGLLVHRRLAADEAYIEQLAVSTEARRRGVGRALIDACDAVARASAKRRLTLWVASDNAAAIGLYMAQGFTRTRVRRTLRARVIFRVPAMVFMERPVPPTLTAPAGTAGTRPA